MLSYDDALDIIRQLPASAREETIPISDAVGRVAARAIALDRDQPGFDRATMDGFALALDGEKRRFRVIGTIHAGENLNLTPVAGEAVRIMTGAPCPPGTTVVPIEQTDGGAETVEVQEPGSLVAGRHIAWRGEDGRTGDAVVAPGQRLNPAMVSAIAMAGVSEVTVWSRPRISVVTTGDEVGGPGRAGIRDSNGPLLVSLLRTLSCDVVRTHVRDEAEATERALGKARDEADVVVTVGGVSMGTKDLIPGTAARLGYEQVFHKVAMQPGKPVLVCRHGAGGFLAGLPGNPVSVLATGHLILAPLVGRLLGGWEPGWTQLPLVRDHHHRGRRRLFLPANVVDGGVAPILWNGSGDLLAAASGDGFLDLAPGTKLDAGQTARFLPYLGSRLGERGTLPPRDRS